MDVRVLARRWVRAVLVHEGIAAGGVADSAVFERLRSDDGSEAYCGGNKNEPCSDRVPRSSQAPATDGRHRPHPRQSRSARSGRHSEKGSRTSALRLNPYSIEQAGAETIRQRIYP